MFHWGKLSLERQVGVDEHMVLCASEVLSESDVWDYTIPWMGGKRNTEEQNSLYKNGASRADGYTNKSAHQKGEALDVQPVGFTKLPALEVEKRQKWFAGKMLRKWSELQCRDIIPKNKILVWGGTFTTINDPAHYETQWLKGV